MQPDIRSYRKYFLVITTIIVLLTLISFSQPEDKKTNIIVFLVDDLGWNDTSLPLAGTLTAYNMRYRTPNLETLAQQGVTLSNAHSQSLCVPSRASLLSGRNAIHHGVTGDYTTTYDQYNKLEIPAGTVLDLRYALPQLLKKEGYYTIHAGKYHLCEYEGQKPAPEDIGFDINIAGSLLGAPGSYYGKDNFISDDADSGYDTFVGMPGLEKYHGTDTHLTEALTKEAIEEIRNAVSADKPFFLYLSHYAVHTPIQAHNPYFEEYDFGMPGKLEEEKYASMIEGVDSSLGIMMEELDKLGITDNTLIVFYSDNGGRVLWRGKESLYGKYSFNYPLRSGKSSIYEGGLRVPAVIRWPGVIEDNSESNIPVMIEDIYNTVMEAAGAEIPSGHKTDGINIIPYLTRTRPISELDERSLFFYLPYRFEGAYFEGPDFANGGVTPSSAIIRNNWKLIYFHADERFELYNLQKDIGEQDNLVFQYPQIASDLVLLLDGYLKSYNAIHPLRIPEAISVSWPGEAYRRFIEF